MPNGIKYQRYLLFSLVNNTKYGRLSARKDNKNRRYIFIVISMPPIIPFSPGMYGMFASIDSSVVFKPLSISVISTPKLPITASMQLTITDIVKYVSSLAESFDKENLDIYPVPIESTIK